MYKNDNPYEDYRIDSNEDSLSDKYNSLGDNPPPQRKIKPKTQSFSDVNKNFLDTDVPEGQNPPYIKSA